MTSYGGTERLIESERDEVLDNNVRWYENLLRPIRSSFAYTLFIYLFDAYISQRCLPFFFACQIRGFYVFYSFYSTIFLDLLEKKKHFKDYLLLCLFHHTRMVIRSFFFFSLCVFCLNFICCLALVFDTCVYVINRRISRITMGSKFEL